MAATRFHRRRSTLIGEVLLWNGGRRVGGYFIDGHPFQVPRPGGEEVDEQFG